jgi:tRNA pseudouridine32 synthase / 23S rRNA pseudouridine746 synthase
VNFAERVLYRDGMMLVVDKPAGLDCTPAARGKVPHLGQFLSQLTFGKTTLPQVAHRLDRETTGCLILGRHAKALRLLGEMFQQHRIGKVYWAVSDGLWGEDGLLDAPIDGQPAQTHVRCLRRGPDWSFLELQPVTGRTHQLRIHCAGQGHPLRGDARYGGSSAPTLFLHARRVEVPLYPKKPPVQVEAPLPEGWATYC